MSTHNFFDFRSKLSYSTVRAHAIGLTTILDSSGGTILESDYYKLILGDYNGIHFPVIFKQESGKKWDDILNTGWPSLYLISDKLKSVLEEANLTGWKTFLIKLLDKKENEIPGYHGFSITGHCGPIEYTECEILQKSLVEGGPVWNFYKGLYVGLDQWDGSDFFHPEENYGIIVTAKTADLLKKNKISNVFLENLADVETDEGIVSLSAKKRLPNQPTE